MQRADRLYAIAGGLLHAVAVGIGACIGFVFTYIFLGPFAILGFLLGGLPVWGLTRWMTMETDLSLAPPRKKGIALAYWVGVALAGAGVLIPVLSLPWLFGCTDECQGFAVSIIFGGLVAFLGVLTLSSVASDVTVRISATSQVRVLTYDFRPAIRALWMFLLADLVIVAFWWEPIAMHTSLF